MMAEEKKETREKNELKEKPMSFMTLVVLTGLVGGILFSGWPISLMYLI